jgi:hypothetical protein
MISGDRDQIPEFGIIFCLLCLLFRFPRFFSTPLKFHSSIMGPSLGRLLVSLVVAEVSALGISGQQPQSTVTPRSAILYHNSGNWTVSRIAQEGKADK